MTNARDDILGRIRAALHDVPSSEVPADVTVADAYLHASTDSHEVLIERFVDRLIDYKAKVQLVDADQLEHTIAAACAARGAQRLVVPADAPAEWLPAGLNAIRDSGQRSHRELDGCDGVITGCAIGIAQTGTIILDHGPRQGRRAISLLPDYHLCIVHAEQIVGLVPEALVGLAGAAHARRPLTMISGPSATSDIELNRVEGVHGPRTLEVLIVRPPHSA
jgi:L-lactate dehydrogenase complex protein LldG